MTRHGKRTFKVIATIACALAIAGSAQATTWNAADDFTAANRWTNTTSATDPWMFMGSTLDSGGVLGAMNANNWKGDYYYDWTVRPAQGHGWNDFYWAPRFVKNAGSAETTYSERLWTYEGDWNTTVSLVAPVGKLFVLGNAGYITQNSAVMRFVAPTAGSYNIALTFTGATQAFSNANVALKLNGAAQWTDVVTAYGQAKGYTTAVTLNAGDRLDAVVTGQDFVMMDFTVSDAPVATPEPTSVFAFASALAGLAGLGVRRRRA